MGDFLNVLQKIEAGELPEREAAPEPSEFVKAVETPATGIDEQVVRNIAPDKAAELYNTSKKTGLPLSLVKSAPDAAKKALPLEGYYIPRHSVISDFRGNDILLSSMTADDTEKLDNVVSLWNKTKQAYKEGDIDSNINLLIYRREILNENPDPINREIERLNSMRTSPIQPEGFIEKLFTATAKQLPQQIETQKKGVERGFLGATIGAAGSVATGQPLAAPVLAAEGFGISYKAGTIEGIFAQEFGGAHQDFSQIKDMNGNPLDPRLVKAMAVGSAGINSLLEFLSFKKLLKTIPGGDKLLSKITKETVTETLLKQTVKDKLFDIVKDAGVSWTTEIWTETLQEIVPIVMGELTKDLIEKLDIREFRDMTKEEFSERISGIVRETMYSALGFIIPGTSARVAGTVLSSDISQRFNNDNNQINEAVNETKTKQRSPDHANRFLKMLGMGQPVFLSSEGIETLYQENKQKDADSLLQKLGVNPDKARQLAATGQDVEITQSDAHALLEKDEFNKIAKDLKPAPSAYTQREIDANIAAEDVAQAVKIQQDKAAEAKKVKEQVERLASEIRASKIGTEAAETTPVLLSGIADNLSMNSEKTKSEVLESLSFRRLPFERFKEFLEKGKALFQGEKGIIIDPDKLTNDVLKKINDDLKGKGFDVRGIKDIDNFLDPENKLSMVTKDYRLKHPAWVDSYKKAVGIKEKVVIKEVKKSDLQNINWERVKELGETESLYEAGYITPEGSLIDLSGKKEGGTPGTRSLDHREVGSTSGMQELIAFGYVRMDFNAGTLDMSKKPTTAQIKTIREFINEKDGEIVLDLELGLGEFRETEDAYRRPEITFAREYVSGTSSDRIINDIKRFFGGQAPLPVRLFQAQKGKPPKGAFSILENNKKFISLFEEADLSTILHETAHFAFNEYLELERAGTASESLLTDLETVRQWVGAGKGAALTTPQLEKFAKGFELWLMEGKAPNIELESVFARFQRWLANIYKSVRKAQDKFGIKLNKDIRGVFDRMVSISDSVTTATENLSIKTKEELNALGVIDEDKRYMNRAIKDVMRKAEKKLTKKLNKDYRQNIAKWKAESETEIRAENPIYDTIDSIVANDELRLDKAEFIEIYGKEALSNLPDRGLTIELGVPIDETAITFGYDSGDAFIQDLFNTQPLREAIAQRVSEKRARHDAQFKAEDFIVGTKEYNDYVDILSKYIDKNLEGTPRERKLLSRAAIKNAAKETIRQMSVKEAQRVDKFISAMKKAANDERRAILRKDWKAAARANERMRFNQVMAAESVKIREKVDSILRRAKRKAGSKSITHEHLEAIKHLVTQFRLADILPQEPGKAPDYNKLFAPEYNQDDPGAPANPNDGFQMPDFMTTGNMVKDYRGLSIDQLTELDNAIRYLAKQGNLDKNKYLSDGVTELEADVVDPSVEKMNTVKPKKIWEKGSIMHRVSERLQKIFANLNSLNFTALYLDGFTNVGKDGVKGIVERYVIDPIKRANNERIVRKRDLDAALKPHYIQIRKTLQKWGFSRTGNITIEGAPLPDILRQNGQTKGWFGNQIFAIALNANESNRERLKAGLGLTDKNLRAIYDHLSEEDWRAVRGIWSAVNTLFDDVDKVHLKLKGYHVTKVEATPVNTKHGTFMAGYYPLKYDPNLDFIVEDRKGYADEIAKMDANFVTPFAKSGFTQQRVGGVSLPVLLELGIIDSHINDVLQYVYFSEAIRDADRITRHERFREAAVRIIGRPAYKSIRPALKYIINPKRTGMDLPLARTVEWAKGIGTAWVLAWNTGVAIKQPLSTFGGIRDIGLRNYVNGFSSVLMSPMAHYQAMVEMSTYMANRKKNFDRELQRNFHSLDSNQRAFYFGDKAVTWDDVVDVGFWQIRMADTVTVLPIWYGAFNGKINADQSNLQEAIEYADDIVRNSQPSAQALDLSSWQRDGGVVRLFSMFQTFTVGKYGQRQRLNYNAWRNGSISTMDYAYFNFMDAIAPLVAINLLQALIWGRDVEDKEEQKEMVLKVMSDWALMGVPFASSLKYAFDSGELMNSVPIEALDQVWQGVRGVIKLKDFDNKKKRDKALWGLLNAISITSRVPLSKIISKAQKGEKDKNAMPLIKYVIPPPKKKR